MGEDFSVIHAGESTEDNKKRFNEAFLELSISPPPIVHWPCGEPVEAIVRTICEQGVELLILGALEKEIPGRHYTGTVARSIMREAPCSLLFLTEPSLEPKPLRQIVAITDFSELSALSLKHASFLAEQQGAERIHLVRIFTVFAQMRERSEEFVEADQRQALLEVEEKRVADFAAASGPSTVPIEARCVEGSTGMAASDYVEAVQADLLVVPSQAPGDAPLFPEGMDWMFNAIPSNLLIVRKASPVMVPQAREAVPTSFIPERNLFR